MGHLDVTGLNADTQHRFRVVVHSAGGDSNWSAWRYFRTTRVAFTPLDGWVTASTLNIRSSPSNANNGNIIGSINRNAQVRVVGQSGVWWRISSPRAGYVHSNYITFVPPDTGGVGGPDNERLVQQIMQQFVALKVLFAASQTAAERQAIQVMLNILQTALNSIQTPPGQAPPNDPTPPPQTDFPRIGWITLQNRDGHVNVRRQPRIRDDNMMGETLRNLDAVYVIGSTTGETISSSNSTLWYRLAPGQYMHSSFVSFTQPSDAINVLARPPSGGNLTRGINILPPPNPLAAGRPPMPVQGATHFRFLRNDFPYRPEEPRVAPRRMHAGIDISMREGASSINANIIAPFDGQVVEIGTGHSWKGSFVIVESTVNGITYRFLFAHLSHIGVAADANVTRGQVLGRMGRTGNSAGEHLHMEVRRYPFNGWGAFRNHMVDPRKFWW